MYQDDLLLLLQRAAVESSDKAFVHAGKDMLEHLTRSLARAIKKPVASFGVVAGTEKLAAFRERVVRGAVRRVTGAFEEVGETALEQLVYNVGDKLTIKPAPKRMRSRSFKARRRAIKKIKKLRI